MIVFGTKFFRWGNELTAEAMHCGTCGSVAQFIKKKGMRFFTIFFVIPIFPISGVSESIQCPNCKTRYQAN